MEAKEVAEDAKIKCIIHSMDVDEKDMVLGLNGKIIQAKLGEEVELVKDEILVIKDAVIEVHEAETKDGQPTGKTRVVKCPRYIVEVVI